MMITVDQIGELAAPSVGTNVIRHMMQNALSVPASLLEWLEQSTAYADPADADNNLVAQYLQSRIPWVDIKVLGNFAAAKTPEGWVVCQLPEYVQRALASLVRTHGPLDTLPSAQRYRVVLKSKLPKTVSEEIVRRQQEYFNSSKKAAPEGWRESWEIRCAFDRENY